MSNEEISRRAYEIAEGKDIRRGSLASTGGPVDEFVGMALELSMHVGEPASIVLDWRSNPVESSVLAGDKQAA
jgi:hypothetical protein